MLKDINDIAKYSMHMQFVQEVVITHIVDHHETVVENASVPILPLGHANEHTVGPSSGSERRDVLFVCPGS